jgi:GT2 family glycosyltransferase
MKLTLTQLITDLQIGDELFWEPLRLARPGSWSGHIPAAFWLTKIVTPRVFVELGTHAGNSYSAFCQAVSLLGLATQAFAIDTWQGDEHAGFYSEDVYREFNSFNESHFATFSKLLRTTFDDARACFDEGSIDLLHIDGLHSYEAVEHDFANWKGALSDRAVVIFHDTNVRERNFGVWKLWLELAESYPSFEFHHSEGLGVLGVGGNQPRTLRRLFELRSDPESAAIVRRFFAARGELYRTRSQLLELDHLSDELEIRAVHVADLEKDLARVDAASREHLLEISKRDELIRSLQQQSANRDGVLAERERVLSSQAESIAKLQRELASRDHDLNLREQELQKSAESAIKLQMQLNAVTDEREQDRKLARERITTLELELSRAQRQLGLVETSTSWKVLSRTRALFDHFPGLRRDLARIARAFWWTVTLQLFRRLRERRQLFHRRHLIATSTLFDAAWYLLQNPDINESGYDPALHYVLFGARERRNPGPYFDARAYLERNPDVAEAGSNPLLHYLEYGASEGRVITAVGASPPEESEAKTEVPPEPPNRDYQGWIQSFDTITEDDSTAIRRHIAELRELPLISVVMPVYNTKTAFLRDAVDSVMAQLYPHWELCIADDASSDPDVRTILDDYARRDRRIKLVYRSQNGHISAASNSALELAKGTFIALVDHDDELAEHALYMVAVAINEHPESDIIYSDEDKIDSGGVRQMPYFKPDWNPELFYSQNYLSHLGVYRASLVKDIAGFREGYEGSQDYDLALRIVARTVPDRIRHIPYILYHWRTAPGVRTFSIDSLPIAVEASRSALADYLAARGEDAEVMAGRLLQFNRVVRKAPYPLPRVSLIVPTRDRLSLLRMCIDGLLHHTAYENLEVIIVDNDSSEPATLDYLEGLRSDSRVQVLRVEGEFNYSALNNRAVGQSTGELIGMINNDIEVIHTEWLREMVAELMQPGVGAVGAKLYYPDNTIQHAGVILGLGGIAGHSHLRQPRSDPGYFGRLHLVHEVSCVTGACLLVRKSAFLDVGGLDEESLKIAFNDVDLCLKLRRAGYRIIWTPYAELYHHESASRGYDFDPVRVERISRESRTMTERWDDELAVDPFYNPNLSLIASENYKPAFPPRIGKPWLRSTSSSNGSHRDPVPATMSENCS